MKGSGSANAEDALPAYYRFAAGVLTLHLHVAPGAAHTAWAGLHGEGALKLRLAAPPVDGRANRACVDFLAGAAGVPRSAVTLVRGRRSRAKTVRIAPLSADQFRELQRQWQT